MSSVAYTRHRPEQMAIAIRPLISRRRSSSRCSRNGISESAIAPTTTDFHIHDLSCCTGSLHAVSERTLSRLPITVDIGKPPPKASAILSQVVSREAWCGRQVLAEETDRAYMPGCHCSSLDIAF